MTDAPTVVSLHAASPTFVAIGNVERADVGASRVISVTKPEIACRKTSVEEPSEPTGEMVELSLISVIESRINVY
ncbi:hypothetical protein ANCCEY_08602 [Ancylostoma ceylanicum]|uniref:Uncharacterized protein n=2 Tax=Ancylostoma ceylanicum TaxID=53326 RepID=A0A0D6LK53_9BILA|nr:hypothetical protein ANCCEY_08602 [Ancylostoma ceylanicum]EYC15475.1 hypothetical protein Y032_0036g3161 [Ancylostoma ceylanicum]